MRIANVYSLLLPAALTSCLILVPGCGDPAPMGTPDGGAAPDGGAMDGGVGDRDAASPVDAASPLDAAAPVDAASTDGATEDASASDAGDTGPDASPIDAGTPAAGGTMCGYLDLDIYIVDCAGGYRYLRRWQPTSGDPGECPEYYTLGPMRFDTLEAALGSDSCDPNCTRGASTSVSAIRCGRRTGWIVFRDVEDDCGEVYETPDGLFASLEEWDSMHPCP